MKLGENKIGLMAKDYMEKQTKAVIIGDIMEHEFISRAKKPFKKFSIPIQLEDGHKCELGNLMRSDLNDLVEFYSEDSETWKGKGIEFEAYKNEDGFYNWSITAVLKVENEVMR